MKTFFKLTSIIFLTFFFTHCGKDSDDINCIDQELIIQNTDTMCVEVFEPVCCCNNESYSNECYAKKAGVTSFIIGQCD